MATLLSYGARLLTSTAKTHLCTTHQEYIRPRHSRSTGIALATKLQSWVAT